MKRRQLLARALPIALYLGFPAAGALGASSASGRKTGEAAPHWRTLADRLTAALPNRREASSIGRAHLRTLDRTPDPADLVSEIMADLAPSPTAHKGHARGDLRKGLQAQNAADFAAKRTVLVNGWVFGATETRLFCLAALT